MWGGRNTILRRVLLDVKPIIPRRKIARVACRRLLPRWAVPLNLTSSRVQILKSQRCRHVRNREWNAAAMKSRSEADAGVLLPGMPSGAVAQLFNTMGPTARNLITSLISSIPTPESRQAPHENPLTSTPAAKNIFLTLHVLFQNELLPALDLLDRGLVVRLRLAPPHVDDTQRTAALRVQEDRPAATEKVPGPTEAAEDCPEASKTSCYMYYVRSGRHQSSRNHSRFCKGTSEQTTYYEVKLNAWSCSCPAFTFSAFPSTAPARSMESSNSSSHSGAQDINWLFGGLTRGGDMPICKHLLACVLVEHGNAFTHFVEEREVSAEEMAGWAAGWGD